MLQDVRNEISDPILIAAFRTRVARRDAVLLAWVTVRFASAACRVYGISVCVLQGRGLGLSLNTLCAQSPNAASTGP